MPPDIAHPLPIFERCRGLQILGPELQGRLDAPSRLPELRQTQNLQLLAPIPRRSSGFMQARPCGRSLCCTRKKGCPPSPLMAAPQHFSSRRALRRSPSTSRASGSRLGQGLQEVSYINYPANPRHRMVRTLGQSAGGESLPLAFREPCTMLPNPLPKLILGHRGRVGNTNKREFFITSASAHHGSGRFADR